MNPINYKKLLILLIIPSLIILWGYRTYTTYQQDNEDSTQQVDMSIILDDVFQNTVYLIINNTEVKKRLGTLVQVDSSLVRTGWSKINAWIFFPIASTRGTDKRVATVLIDVDKEPGIHKWKISNIEIDFNDGHKHQLGVQSQEFDIMERFEYLVMRLEAEHIAATKQSHRKRMQEMQEKRERLKNLAQDVIKK